MNEYTVEFTTTITVCADSEDEAVDKAYDMVSMDDMYIYVNGNCTN